MNEPASRCSPDGSARGAREARCACGSLLARLTAGGVELKCRRCKRIVLVPWSRGRRAGLRAPAHERDPP
jgi:hypothetical protein